VNLLKRIFGLKSSRSPDAAVEVARVLFEEWVQKDPAPGIISQAELSESLWLRFQSKWRLYREAIVLMVLLSREQKDSRYSELVREYERLIYPENPTPEGLAKLSAVKAAMQDIAELIDHGKGKELTWSAKWFTEFPEELFDPVTCYLFSMSCLQTWTAVAKSLEALAADGIVP